jgi:hypothetical protein
MARAKMTQCEKILQYIEEYQSITPLDALREFGCMRLASRITDLRRRGYPITREMETAKNRAGEPVRYARYRMGGSRCT